MPLIVRTKHADLTAGNDLTEESMSGRDMDKEYSLSPERAAAMLEDIAMGLRNGEVVFDDGENSLVFKAGSSLDMEIEAKEKRGKSRIKIEMFWRVDPEESLAYSNDAISDPGV